MDTPWPNLDHLTPDKREAVQAFIALVKTEQGMRLLMTSCIIRSEMDWTYEQALKFLNTLEGVADATGINVDDLIKWISDKKREEREIDMLFNGE